MNKFSDIQNNNKIGELLSLADKYERQLANYRFFNDQLFELDRLERRINETIKPFLDNEDLLLSAIKSHWSIIRFVRDDKDFLIKACQVNPKCASHVSDLSILAQLYNIDPKIVEHAAPFYKDKLAEYLKNNPQKETQKFYSFDGQIFETMEEAVARNTEIQNNLTVKSSP